MKLVTRVCRIVRRLFHPGKEIDKEVPVPLCVAAWGEVASVRSGL